jgi:protein involved in polysaccharide export with SLBB domain
VKRIACLVAIVAALPIYSVEIPNSVKMELLENQRSSPTSSSSFSGSPPDATDSYNSINPDQYFIGGGDVFSITIIGNTSITYTATINRECELYVPELGIRRLGKTSLTEAIKLITEFVQTKLRKTNEVHVELTKAKKVTASINGAVANPGTYSFPGTYRILDALRLANNGVTPSLNECNLREVLCTSRDSAVTIDLFGYLLRNDITCNPYLYPCENINVSLATRRVFLNAPTKTMVGGWVPLKDGETLAGFLSLFKFDASADTNTVVFQSSTSENTRLVRNISRSEMPSILLQDRDIVTVPIRKNYAPIMLVAVTGEVAQPGSFPILRDSTTVGEVLQIAGGPTQYADLDRTVIVRLSKMEDRPADSLRATGVSAIVRPEMNSGFSRMSSLKDFAVVDVKNAGMSAKLYSNDHIIVPARDNSVYISGNVKRAGSYPFVAGKPYKYYIGLAGGFTGKSDKTNVFGVRNFGNISQITDLSEVRPADIIVVPDSQQAKFLISVFLPVLQTVATIVSVFLAIFTISKK